MSGEIEVRRDAQIAPRIGFDEMKNMAEVMAKSKILGNWDTPDKILTVMLISQAEDCNPMQAIFRYDPIPGKTGVMARKKPIAMLADFQKRGGKLKWITTTPQEAKGEFTMQGHEPFVFGYTWQEAVRAGLANKDNWAKNPSDMLRWQVVGRGLRVFDPASTGLMYTPYDIPEENEDTVSAPAPTVTPPQELFGVRKAGRPPKKDKVEIPVVGEVVDDGVVPPSPSTPPTASPATPTTKVEEAIKDATISNPAPKTEPVKTASVKELTDWQKYIKTLVDAKLEDKVRGVLCGLKWLTPGASFDTVTVARQENILKQADKFRKKVENYQPFGVEA